MCHEFALRGPTAQDRTMSAALLAILFSFSFALAKPPSKPEKYAYPAQKVSLRGVREIKIIGVRGSLKMHGYKLARGMSLKVQHTNSAKSDDWHLSVDRRGHVLYLEVFNTAYGKQWRTQVKEELWPEFDIEMDGPARPTTVSWREGSLEFTNWNSDLEVSFLKGRARVDGGHGDLTLQPVQASVDVRGRRGKITIKGESGAVSLSQNQGALDLNWLRGEIHLQECRGPLHIESGNSQVSIEGGDGSLDMQLAQGRAKITGFQGLVKGKGEAAQWEVSASAPSDLNFTTSSGPVGVSWKAGGAKVFLTSTQGTIETPGQGFLQSSEREGQRIVEGTRSAKPMGQVFVRTDSGAIRWSQ